LNGKAAAERLVSDQDGVVLVKQIIENVRLENPCEKGFV
jgi:hypothetical protein